MKVDERIEEAENHGIAVGATLGFVLGIGLTFMVLWLIGAL